MSAQHVPDNPYPDEKETTVYQIGHSASILIILCFALLVLVPVAVDHVLRLSHSDNGVAHAKRQAFFFEVLNPPAFDPETPRPEDKRIVHHLRWLERGLDRAGYATTLRQNVQEQITEQFAEGNRKVFIGFDGWLFYQAGHPGAHRLRAAQAGALQRHEGPGPRAATRRG